VTSRVCDAQVRDARGPRRPALVQAIGRVGWDKVEYVGRVRKGRDKGRGVEAEGTGRKQWKGRGWGLGGVGCGAVYGGVGYVAG